MISIDSLPICTESTSDIRISLICTHYYIQNIKKYRVRYLDHLSPTTIAWSTFRSISSVDHPHHLLLFFPLTCCHNEPPWDALCDASVSSSSSSCCPPLAVIWSSPPHLPCSDMNTVDAEVMIGSSPMTDGKSSLTSSRRHHTRHPMEARCDSKSKNKTAEGDEDD